ncbi:MAG: hypothetical protein HWE34_11590 [Methylocystaceae bacterium]|nr:hypothetical protein [Methylocystaceae bacterium]
MLPKYACGMISSASIGFLAVEVVSNEQLDRGEEYRYSATMWADVAGTLTPIAVGFEFGATAGAAAGAVVVGLNVTYKGLDYISTQIVEHPGCPSDNKINRYYQRCAMSEFGVDGCGWNY